MIFRDEHHPEGLELSKESQGAPVIEFALGENDCIFLRHPGGRLLSLVIYCDNDNLRIHIPLPVREVEYGSYLALDYHMPPSVEELGGALPAKDEP